MLNLPNPVPVQIRGPDMRLRIPAPQECLVTRSSRTEDDLAGLWCLHPHAEMLSDSDGLNRTLPQSISALANDYRMSPEVFHEISTVHTPPQKEDIMTALEIGKEVAALCRQGKNQEAIDRFYSPNIESVEACAMPGMDQTQLGIAKIKGKNQWWVDNHQIHGGTVDGPYPNGDRFILHFKYDVTPKHTGKRMTLDETGLYTVQNGKIVKEEFFYSMSKPEGGPC